MTTLPLLCWIRNAFAVLCGRHGAVADSARHAGCSRQTAYDHADKLQQALSDARLPGPSRAQLLDEHRRLTSELAALRHELQGLRAAAATRLDFGPQQQQRWAVTLTAWGLSLRQIAALFAELLGSHAPSRATLGRWSAAAGHKAAAVLEVLDEATQPRVRQLAADELFVRRQPVLMAVEPASLTLAVCRRSADCSAASWAAAVRPFAALEYAVCDGGGGLRGGLRAEQRRRAAAQAVPLELGRDVFHISLDAEPQLRRQWRALEHAWGRAEAAEAARRRTQRQAQPTAAAAARVQHAWARVGRRLADYDAQEQAWRRARQALRLFRRDGRLNDPQAAAAEVSAACAALPGEGWAAVRRALADERTLTPLRRLQRQLVEAEPRAAVRAAVVRLVEWERRARAAAPHESGLWSVRLALQRSVCTRLAEDWRGSYERVRAAVAGVVRASSCVECVNSVLRMHQSRHRKLPQGLLDLKRLWWNCHRFGAGRRRGRCPYELLGLRLGRYDFWEVLQSEPQALRAALAQQAEELSSAKVAA